MKKNLYFLPAALVIVLGVAYIALSLLRSFAPWLILPEMSIPNMVLLSLAALLLDHYVAKGAKRCYFCIIPLSFLAFGLLPYAAGFLSIPEALKIASIGTAVFTVLTWLFTSAMDRLSTGPKAIFAPPLTALGLYLACQCFAGLI